MNWEIATYVIGTAGFLLLASRAMLHRGLPAGRMVRLALVWAGIILALWAVVTLVSPR